jgi:hypothetical protein
MKKNLIYFFLFITFIISLNDPYAHIKFFKKKNYKNFLNETEIIFENESFLNFVISKKNFNNLKNSNLNFEVLESSEEKVPSKLKFKLIKFF